ncbi:response regulator transcription factor [Duganella dendranthematis]|jgi:two-component system NarL family response regulator|uniref:Response regulator transcription factor n=1 Tax=Duganella dendranthematis TaxID=2728021 RepID=A0ABX6MHI0_9BURK|nr:response regulator transcription factor [Duganella dendranthematis]QJD93789.1 response regulator transcription factor [Duganella dendranthematis]
MRVDTRSWPQSAVGGTGNTNGIVQQGDKVHVLIAHADPIVNAGLAALLGANSDMQITVASSEAASLGGADVIVLDHRNGLEHMRRAANAHHGDSQPRVLIVTQLEREWEVRTAMMAGVHGYLLQNSDAEQLLTAVRTLSRGMRYLSADLSRCVADSFTRIGLTSRETDVLQLLAQGQCNKSIARELGIGVGTVKTHVKGLFDKLGATARTHAVVLATRRGLVGDSAATPAH